MKEKQMTVIKHNPPELFPPYRCYSHATEIRGDSRLLIISGLNGYLSDGVTMPESFEEQGKPHGFTSRNTDTQPKLEALRHAQAQIDDWYISYADGLSDAAHNEVVHFTFVDGGAGAMARGDMLLHVVNHKTYHRGYVADMLYQASSRPPTMDLPVFLRNVPLVL